MVWRWEFLHSFTLLKYQKPESGPGESGPGESGPGESGPGEGKKKHRSGSRSTVYQVGVALSCLKIAFNFMATLLPQLEMAAVAVTPALSVGSA